AEGFERGTTNGLLAFLNIARGSAGEGRSMLTVLAGWGKFRDLKSQISNLTGKLERILKKLYRWTGSFKKTDNAGQRRLDEKAKNRYTNRKEREQFLEELRRISEKGEK